MWAARAVLLGLVSLLVVTPCSAANETPAKTGYLRTPPVFLRDEKDVPLNTFAAYVPKAKQVRLVTSSSSPESDGFASGGDNVQPQLRLDCYSIGGGVVAGLGNGWAVGGLLPWSRTRVSYAIGGQPASGTARGFGAPLLFGKRMLWSNGKGRSLVGSLGVELPMGEDDATFDQSNTVTNSYYAGYPARMPLSWQSSNGAWNTHMALSYLTTAGNNSQEFIVALKFHGSGDEDVKSGNIAIASWNATLGLSEKVAAAVGLTLRVQSDDKYPNAPSPGIGQPALAGTTTHGTALWVDPTIRYNISRNLTIGLGMRQILTKPDNGMIPRSSLYLILYPKL